VGFTTVPVTAVSLASLVALGGADSAGVDPAWILPVLVSVAVLQPVVRASPIAVAIITASLIVCIGAPRVDVFLRCSRPTRELG
jgi:hypothetical protein